MEPSATGHVQLLMRFVVVAVVLLVAGCAEDDREIGGTASADCSAQIRVGDDVFTSYTYAHRKASRYGTADAAECHDVGEDAAGSVFPEDPRQVRTWVFEGYPPDEVLGVRIDGFGFAVYVADSLSDDERERIFDELSPPAR